MDPTQKGNSAEDKLAFCVSLHKMIVGGATDRIIAEGPSIAAGDFTLRMNIGFLMADAKNLADAMLTFKRNPTDETRLDFVKKIEAYKKTNASVAHCPIGAVKALVAWCDMAVAELDDYASLRTSKKTM